MIESVCYCKKCKGKQLVELIEIDEKDRATFILNCGHKRVYQLITSSEDYK